MSIKKSWSLVRAGVNTVLTNNYRDRVASGTRYSVCLRFVVSGGPQHGREVELFMTPDEAKAYADSLRDAALRTGVRNGEAGYQA